MFWHFHYTTHGIEVSFFYAKSRTCSFIVINTATLKDTFKGIYGQPIGTYMKEYRIKQAAILLRQTQATIAEIANQVGYENQSKFATAFRDVLKIAPAEYRKQNSGD